MSFVDRTSPYNVDAIEPVAAHGAPSVLNRGAKTVTGSRSRVQSQPAQFFSYLLFARVRMLSAKRRSLHATH
jgi:hypothetical protein